MGAPLRVPLGLCPAKPPAPFACHLDMAVAPEASLRSVPVTTPFPFDRLNWPGLRETLARPGGQYPIATTQAHHRIDGFDFVREVTASATKHAGAKGAIDLLSRLERKTVANEALPITPGAWRSTWTPALDATPGFWPAWPRTTFRSSARSGPRGREMLWLRVDRYDSGDPGIRAANSSPSRCMHCEKAPCEIGCPVHATVHGRRRA